MYTFTSCQTFAGGLDMGMVQSGLKMVHKVEQAGGFGMPNCVANKHLLGDFTHDVGDYREWRAPQSDILASNPPCSGFSLMTDHKHRGMDAKVNTCMWVVMDYAARIRPRIVIMESVRQAYTNGHDLMTALRAKLEELTGWKYNLYHVMQDAIELGGAARRPRYFWTAVREDVHFGVSYPDVPRRPQLWDTISDLQYAPITWNEQPHRLPPTWWTAHHARGDLSTFDGHIIQKPGIPTYRALDLYDFAMEHGVEWHHGGHIGQIAKAVYEKVGRLPDSWESKVDGLLAKDFHMGFMSLTRWHPWKDARVITGSALAMVLHPFERRTITHREAARVMGFPDDWKIKPLRNYGLLPATWGKGVTVQCGLWMGTQARNALDGAPGPSTGVEVREREWLITHPANKNKFVVKHRMTAKNEQPDTPVADELPEPVGV